MCGLGLAFVYIQSMNKQQKEKDREQLRNILWLYNLSSGRWSSLASKTPVVGATSTSHALPEEASEPVPRFAHQLVYDHIRKVCNSC